jgi:hypothetical protein
MACIYGQRCAVGKIVYADIAKAIGKMKRASPKGELVNTARSVGIHFGNE